MMLLIGVLVTATPVLAANLDRQVHKHRSHHRTAYVRIAPAETDYYCREGWWQTLRFGHVRPRWGVRCRYAVLR